MFDLKKILNKFEQKDEKIEQQITQKDLQIATSVIFLEIANADNNISDVEMESILKILRKQFNLSQNEVEELIKISEDRIKDSIDVWQFTNVINKKSLKEDKLKIMENIWKIIYADKRLDKYEDHLAHKFANLLRLSHKDLINTKLKVMKDE